MRTAVPLAVTLSLVALVGCGNEVGAGSGDGATGPTDQPTKGVRTVDDEGTELTVVVAGTGGGRQRYTLTCRPAGGDHPAPDAACRALDALDDPFAPVPADQACTEIYGGPQTASVTGTLRGEPVDAEFDRTNGCQIDRWDAHAALLGAASGEA